jgi:transposase
MNRPQLTASELQRLERQLAEASDVRLYRRTLAVLEHARGRSVEQVAGSLGVSRQSVYNWTAAYLRALDPGALADAPRPGRPRLWTEDEQVLLRCLLETTPERWGHYALNWTVPLLQEQVQQETGVRPSDDTIRRALRAERYVWKRPRYVLEPDPDREKDAADSADRAQIGCGHGSAGRG